VLEEGQWNQPELGTPQGGVVSPLLANIYLHEVLDKWFVEVVKPRLFGRGFLIRYADDRFWCSRMREMLVGYCRYCRNALASTDSGSTQRRLGCFCLSRLVGRLRSRVAKRLRGASTFSGSPTTGVGPAEGTGW
jgi:hypothetical protein